MVFPLAEREELFALTLPGPTVSRVKSSAHYNTVTIYSFGIYPCTHTVNVDSELL